MTYSRWTSVGIVMTLAIAAAVLLVSTSGESDKETPPVASTAPEEPKLVPAWAEVPAGELLEEGGVYAVDVASGSLWRIDPPQQLPSTIPFLGPVPENAEVEARFLQWSREGEAIVQVVLRIPERGSFPASDVPSLHVAVPGRSFRAFTLTFQFVADRFVWSPDGQFLAASGIPKGQSTRQLVVTGPTSRLDLRGTPQSWSGDSRFLIIFDDEVGRGLAVWDSETIIRPEISSVASAWSNNGARLAYVPAPTGWTDMPQPLEIRVRDFIGGSDVLVATIPNFPRSGLAWSSDDAFLAVTSLESPTSNKTNTLIIDVAQRKTTVAVSGSISAGWSSSSSTLLLSGNLCGGNDIFSVEADGTDLRRYTDSGAFDTQPRWAPDGSAAVFVSYGDRGAVVTFLEMRQGEIRELVAVPASTIELFAWSPDGKYIVFSVDAGTGFCEGAEPQTTEVEVLP